MKDTHESCDHAPDRPASSGVQATAYGGLSPNDLSNVIIAYDSGYPNPAGWPVGYAMWAPAKRRIGWVREAFGPTRDVSALVQARRRFLRQFEQVIAIDWQLPAEAFARSIRAALDYFFPELSPEARQVLLARLNHLRCDPVAVAVGRALSVRLARRTLIRPPWR